MERGKEEIVILNFWVNGVLLLLKIVTVQFNFVLSLYFLSHFN